MAEIERLPIVLPVEMAALVRSAVDEDNDTLSSKVVCDPLHDWKTKRALQPQELGGLRADINRGLADMVRGRVQAFDTTRIIERGRVLVAGRSHS